MTIQINRLSLCRAIYLVFTLSTTGALLADETPSNPLSKGMNTDARAQYFELRDS